MTVAIAKLILTNESGGTVNLYLTLVGTNMQTNAFTKKATEL